MNVIYGICGEGLGHVTRSKAIIDRLTALGHTVDIYTYGDAADYLRKSGYPADLTHGSDGLRFANGKHGVSLPKTAAGLAKFAIDMKSHTADVVRLAKARSTSLFISDFEPIVARAAKLLPKVPLASVDNQHRFLRPQPALPLWLRTYCFAAGTYTKWLVPDPDLSIVSTFHDVDVDPKGKFETVGPIVRDEVASVIPSDEGHVLVYIKPYMSSRVLPALRSSRKHRFFVYGSNMPDGIDFNVTYKAIATRSFVADLASCSRVIAAAGNQLISECVYLGKPVLAMPVPRQHEQSVNAFYVKHCNIGMSCHPARLTHDLVERFLAGNYRSTSTHNGLDRAVSLLVQLAIWHPITNEM